MKGNLVQALQKATERQEEQDITAAANFVQL